MLARLARRITSLLRGIDALAEKILNGLYRLYSRLTEKLDGALEKLDDVTKALLRRYYRALEYLEKLFKILQRLLRVIFPIILLFVPPASGLAIASLTYKIYLPDSIILGSMSLLLLLILIASFRSKAEVATARVSGPTKQRSLAITSEIDELHELGVGRKIFGAMIGIAALVGSAFVSVGLFAGFVLFIAEVIVLYILRWMYGTGEVVEPSSNIIEPSPTTE